MPHDAREPVGVVVEDPGGGGRVGLVADLGCRSRLAWARLAGVHALLLEANHDLEMLRNGPYPWSLKQRVAGRHGHLSNADAADGLSELAHEGLRHVVLYHLSQVNNLPALAAAVVGEELARLRDEGGADDLGAVRANPLADGRLRGPRAVPAAPPDGSVSRPTAEPAPGLAVRLGDAAVDPARRMARRSATVSPQISMRRRAAGAPQDPLMAPESHP